MKALFFLFYLIKTMTCTDIYPVYLGQTELKIIKQRGEGKTFIHLHENEQTALLAAKFYIDQHGGSLITLNHSGRRNVRFVLDNQNYEFDPNRIFTDAGIQKTLLENGHYSQKAHQEVKKLSKSLLNLLPEGKKIIAVHNNKDYSIKSYFPDQLLTKDVRALHLYKNLNHRNFFFVTQEKDFKRLVKFHLNVALQAETANNDGSLSYFLSKNRYINVEAGYDEILEQLSMLEKA